MENLPLEILQQISFFMDDRTRRFMRLASTTWFNIIKYCNFTCYFTRAQSLREISNRLSNYQNQNIGLTLLKSARIDETHLIDSISVLTNLTSLSLDSYHYSRRGIDWIKLTTLTKLKYLNINAEYPLELAKIITQLTRLKLDRFNLDFVDVAQILALNSNVQCLEIDTRSQNQRDIFANIANPSILTSFKVDCLRNYQIEPENEFSMSKLVNLKCLDYIESHTMNSFPISRLTSLDYLSLKVDRPSETFVQNTNLTYLAINSKNATAEYLENISKLTKLKNLSLKTPRDSTAHLFLTALTALSNFTLEYFAQDIHDTLEFLNSTRLTSLSLAFEEGNCDPIQKLTSLQELVLRKGNATNANYTISSLTNLKSLILLLGVSNFDFLTHLKYLEELVIDSMVNRQLNGIDFRSLPNLKFLEGPLLDADTFNSLVSCTNLTSLKMKLPEKTGKYDYSILTRLPLREFINTTDVNNDDALWRALGHITTLEEICQNLDDDDKLLYLTGLSRLTCLTMLDSESMTGIHLTALTSIQVLVFTSSSSIFRNNSDPAKTRIEVDNLEMHLPYLYSKQL